LLLRALLSHPKLLLLEEPWLGFDADCKEKVQHYLLHEIPDTTVLLITNETAFAQRCDRIVELQDGVVVKHGKPNETL
jgi:lipoprotein-releasing system ATP-binding protein